MDKKKIDYSLYLVTDRELMSCKELDEGVREAILGGCSIVQLREKNCSSREFFETALKIKKVCREFDVPLIINDRVDIALAADCDGVHIGQKDLPAEYVRKIIGDDKIVGVSASNLEKAKKAQADGADYIGVGAMFSTLTKTDTNSVTPSELCEIKKSVQIPVVAIGGIKKENVGLLSGTGIDGIAVVSAIIAQKDIKAAAMDMKKGFLTLN